MASTPSPLRTWLRGGPERGFYKPSRGRLHRFYSPWALGAAALSIVGFNVLARIAVGGEPGGRALLDTIHTIMSQPVASAMLGLPFFLAAILGVELERLSNRRTGSTIFFACLAGIVVIYLAGYWAAQQSLVAKNWTAASLTIGLMPFKSLGVLLLGALAGFYCQRFFKRRN